MEKDTEPSQQVTQEQMESVAAFKHYLFPGSFYNALSLQAKRKVQACRAFPNHSCRVLLTERTVAES